MAIPNEVVCLRENDQAVWAVVFDGQVINQGWVEKGPASAALSLLEKGAGRVKDGRIIWNPRVRAAILELK